MLNLTESLEQQFNKIFLENHNDIRRHASRDTTSNAAEKHTSKDTSSNASDKLREEGKRRAGDRRTL